MHSNLEGNIGAGNTSGFGLYLDDTRFLSVFELKVNGRPPLLLSSVADRDYMAHIELTNVDVWEGDTLLIPQETLSIRRVRSIKNALYERIRVKNYNGFETLVELEISVAADFLHMFEVRGQRPARKGKHLMPKTTESGVKLAYLGGDNVFRESTVEFSIPPDEIIVGLDKTTAKLSAVVSPGGEFEVDLKVIPSGSVETDGATFTLDQVKEELSASYSEWETQSARVTTDNELFNKVLERGMKDLRALSRPHAESPPLAETSPDEPVGSPPRPRALHSAVKGLRCTLCSSPWRQRQAEKATRQTSGLFTSAAALHDMMLNGIESGTSLARNRLPNSLLRPHPHTAEGVEDRGRPDLGGLSGDTDCLKAA